MGYLLVGVCQKVGYLLVIFPAQARDSAFLMMHQKILEWKWLLIYGKFANRSNQFRTFFSVPIPSGSAYEGSGDLTGRSNISATRGRQDTRFCVCVKAREEIFHT